ncbi:MAG: SulP family inorganic anion transporter [Deltaproteobacteria bacterium]|nr:SulP family inorganic anion transporter [Deltaproteobacteria bacterium]
MLNKVFPFLNWFKNYGSDSLKIDAISGLTVALVLIPQSMAYAQLAGLPPYYGLYASFLPPMLAALFGSSRQLATGPVAVVSLMTAASLEPLAAAGSEGYIAYAILLAFMVGAFQFTLGVCKLGLIVNFLSHPVVNGFTNAAAIIIASSQLSKIFGVYVDKAEHHYETIWRVCEAAFHYIHWPTLILGLLAFGIMYGMRKISPKMPNVLVAVVVTILISWAIGFEHNLIVDIKSIQSPDAIELITNFNKQIAIADQLVNERSEVNIAMDKAGTSHDIIALLAAEHNAKVLVENINILKEKKHYCRRSIRDLLFEGVKQPDGTLKFYPKEMLPLDVKGDGRQWRIKAGNSRIDSDKLLMTGGGAVVGVIPKGLPELSVPEFNFKIILHLLPFTAIISLLGFMEAISIAKAMAAKTGQRLDPNQELIGQGIANIIGSIGKSYPVSGSFSRSAVNLQTGAVSGLSSVFTSIAVIIALLFFTPLLYHLPQSVLAAVIMMAVIGLVNVSGFVHAWKVQWYDGAISIIAFICTLMFAPHLEKGIEVGVVLSLLVFLFKSMRPTLSSLSRAPDKSLRDSIEYGLEECEFVAMIRFEGPLFFASASHLEDQALELLLRKKKLKHIIFVSNGISDIDASGEETLSLFIDNVRSAGIDISFSGVNETVMKIMKRTHLLAKIGENHIYTTMEKALSTIHSQAHADEWEDTCPLLKV